MTICMNTGLMLRKGGHVFEEVCPTLVIGGSDNFPVVVENNISPPRNITEKTGDGDMEEVNEDVRCFENHAQDARYRDAGEVAPTCHSQMGTGGNNVPLVIAAIDGDKLGKKERRGGSGLGIHEEDVSYTCAAKDVHGVALAEGGGGQCLNPHDPQSERIYGGDGAWHSLNANSGGGQSRDGVLTFGKTGHPQNPEQPQGWTYASCAKTLNTFGTPSSEMRAEELVCVHGSQDPICNTDHANAVNRNNGLENCVCGRDVELQRGGSYGDAKKRRPSEILSVLQETIGKDAFQEWAIGRLGCFQEKDVLREGMHEQGVRCETEPLDGKQDLSLPCEETCPARMLRNLRTRICKGCPSQGWGLYEQQSGQSDEDLQELPQQDSQAEKTLCDMWETAEGTWFLHQALGEIQKVQRPDADENQSIHPRLAIRRLTPTETSRLMGFPDGHTIPCFREEDITDELVDYFIGVFWTWDCINAKGGKTPKRKTRKWVRKWLEKISNPATCPDAPRYKAAGNSFCTNVMRWIGLSIEDVESRHKGE